MVFVVCKLQIQIEQFKIAGEAANNSKLLIQNSKLLFRIISEAVEFAL